MPTDRQKALAWIEEKGGKIEECKELTSNPGRMWVRCAANHVWNPQIGFLANHHWCAKCHGNAPLTIEQMQEIAAQRGGKCLSTEYKGLKVHLLWQCSLNHEPWLAIPNNVKNHESWCPHCTINVGEELTRAALCEAFPGENFDKTRRVECMLGLEFDGFNENKRLAFEYQGIQHYEEVPHFHREPGALAAQQARDLHKRTLCEENDYTLLEISYKIKFNEIRAYVRKALLDLGYQIAEKTLTDDEFLASVRALDSKNAEQFNRAKEIIKAKGGECLSKVFISREMPLSIKCAKGHDFEMSLSGFDQIASRGPRFCQKCGGTSPKTDEELKIAAADRGFEFIEAVSLITGTRARRFMRMKCAKGHPVEISIENFFSKDPRGCKTCFDERKGDTNRNHSDVGKQFGVDLEDEYKNATTHYRWRCQRNHIMIATLNSLKAKFNSSKAVCTECILADFGNANELTLITNWNSTISPSINLEWECLECGEPSCISIMTMKRKKFACKTCKRLIVK